jgi:hypothetical protein
MFGTKILDLILLTSTLAAGTTEFKKPSVLAENR